VKLGVISILQDIGNREHYLTHSKFKIMEGSQDKRKVDEKDKGNEENTNNN